MDLGLKIPYTLHLTIVEFILVAIEAVMTEGVDFILKRPSTLTLLIVEKDLMVMGEVDIDLRLAP